MNMNEVITGITLSKVCSISPDKDSNEHKAITLKVKFDGATFQSVFDKAVSGTVINWQNGPGRKNFDKWTNNQLVEIQFTSPAKTTVDPMESIIASAKAAGMTPEQYVMNELKKRQG